MKAAIEDVRVALPENTFASAIQDGIDTLSRSLDDAIDHLDSRTPLDSTEDSDLNNAVQQKAIDYEENFLDDTEENLTSLPSVGDSIEVYWPLDDAFYKGKVSSINDDDNKYSIDYADGDKESLDLSDEVWKYSPQDTMEANNVQTPRVNMKSIEQEVLTLYVNTFGHKDFMKFQAQGLQSFPLLNAYKKEEESFKDTVQTIPVSQVPENANVITSHVIYKVKTNDDGSFKMKARIAPHGNKDLDRDQLKTDSAVCPPIGIRILLSLATMFMWCLAKIDFKSAFLQTGDARRDVYVVPPRESNDKNHYWLLRTASYGLVNANAKWQEHSDFLLKSLGLKQLIYVPQLFYQFDSTGVLKLVAVKIVDDVLLAGSKELLKDIVGKIQMKYELGTVVYGPGSFLFFGLQVCQETDYSITIQADEKISSLECYPISRQRRRESSIPLNEMEMSNFRSVNSSIGWLGTAASPFCAFYASHLQQKVPHTTVHDLISQINSVRLLKKLGSTIKYKRPLDNKSYPLSILVFADASRNEDYGQLGYVAGLLIGDFELGSIFHVLSWSSHKSKRPVKSIGAAEILAAGEAIDDGKLLASAYKKLLGMHIDLIVALDSKDLFATMSTCRNSVDRSIRGDVSVIRYEYETHKVNHVTWIPGKLNLTDPLTKTNSPLTEPLQLTMFSGELPISFDEAEDRSATLSTG